MNPIIKNIIEKNNGLLRVKVVASSSREEIAEVMENGVLKVKLRAPREKGKANEALINLLCRELKIKKSQVTIESGLTKEQKSLRIVF